ncbi:anti-sigma regulatory factor (Ser/Thr protein kinase) [Kineococcus radiotolerans]|uniref:Anti-sigma regulatory factor (Ser/Thr protein kinase) n=1 Tax=Kineococcus radiotolerans TaxID=131568 RepID=A0A7W4TMX2_KINRA|nr:ATP-binding protein [Kineococcus radiotolerans]MBB2901211.1 anti-sigma regulatory factor (Ser/Thr protein kinase) [Kineococcus radiotolerans]
MPATHWATFAHDAASVPRARHVVRTVLDGAGLDEMATAEIEIVLSEIVGNAVRHARPLTDGAIHVQCEITVEVRPHVEIAVTDGGSPGRAVAKRTATDSDTGGRGLSIVDGLADEWGVVEDVDNLSRTVWASFGGPTRNHPH